MDAFTKALEKYGKKYQPKLDTNSEGNIDFTIKTQKAIKGMLLDSLRDSGYIALYMIIGTAWKIKAV